MAGRIVCIATICCADSRPLFAPGSADPRIESQVLPDYHPCFVSTVYMFGGLIRSIWFGNASLGLPPAFSNLLESREPNTLTHNTSR